MTQTQENNLYAAIATLQKNGSAVMAMDQKGIFDKDQAKDAGVILEHLLICIPDNDQNAAAIIEELISKELPEFIVIF